MTILLFLLLLLTINVSAQPFSMEMSVERESSAATPEAASQESTEMMPVEAVPVEEAVVEIVPAAAPFRASALEEQMLRNSFRTLALLPGSTIAGIALEDLQLEDLKIVPTGKMVTVFLPEYSILGFNLGDFVIRYTVLDDKNIEFSWVMPNTLAIEAVLLVADKITAVGTWNADFGAASNFYLQISGLQLMEENTLVAEIAEITFNSEGKAVGEGKFDLRNEVKMSGLQVPGKFSLAEASYFEVAAQGPNNYQILDAYDTLQQIMKSEELGEDFGMLDASAMLSQFAALFPTGYEAGLTLSDIVVTPPMLPEIQLANFTIFSNAKDLDAKSNFDFGYEASGLTLPAGLIPDNFLPFLPEQLRLTFGFENLSIKPLILIAANALSRELADEDTNIGLMAMRLIYKLFADQAALRMQAEIQAPEFSSLAKVRIALNGEAFYLSTADAELTMRGVQALAAQLPMEAQAELMGPMMMMTMLAKEMEKDMYQISLTLNQEGVVLLNGKEQAEMGEALQDLFKEIMDEMDF